MRREDGTVPRRNRKFLRASKETFDDIAEGVLDIPCPQNEEQAPSTESKTQTETEEKADTPQASQTQEVRTPMKTRIINHPHYNQ